MAQPHLAAGRSEFPLHYDPPEDGDALKPQFVHGDAARLRARGTILASGVGQHQMWASQYWRFDQPYTWVNSGGLGTMGFAVPAAIGAKVGRPDRTVWAVDGDGCFQMTAQELVTASSERIPIKVAILNNAYLGMVRQWQEMFYDERYSEVYLSPDLPDYVKWAEAMGCVGVPGGVARGGASRPSRRPTPIDDRPVVIDFRTDAREKVFPMVPAGASNDDVVVAPVAEARRARRLVAVSGLAGPTHQTLSVLVENRSGVLARVSGLFARRGFNITRWRWRRPTTSASAASPSSSTSRRPRSSRSPSSCSSWSTSSRSPSCTPATRSSASCCWPPCAPAPSDRSEVIELVGVFEGKIVDVGTDAAHRHAGRPARPSSTTSRTSCDPTGSVELQRTGRVALPRLDRRHSPPAAVTGKAS